MFIEQRRLLLDDREGLLQSTELSEHLGQEDSGVLLSDELVSDGIAEGLQITRSSRQVAQSELRTGSK